MSRCGRGEWSGDAEGLLDTHAVVDTPSMLCMVGACMRSSVGAGRKRALSVSLEQRAFGPVPSCWPLFRLPFSVFLSSWGKLCSSGSYKCVVRVSPF